MQAHLHEIKLMMTVFMVQLCRWEFLVFSGTFETRLGVEEDLPRGSVVFRLVSSSFMRQFEGRWQVRISSTQSDAYYGQVN